MMCELLYTIYGSVFTLIDFAIFTENALYVFKILSIHLAIPATCVWQIPIVHKLVELAISNSTMYFFICLVQKTCPTTPFF